MNQKTVYMTIGVCNSPTIFMRRDAITFPDVPGNLKTAAENLREAAAEEHGLDKGDLYYAVFETVGTYVPVLVSDNLKSKEI